MKFINEAIHTISCTSPAGFAEYVKVYAETGFSIMRECDINIFGAFQFANGEVGRDLLLITYEETAAYEQAFVQLAVKIAEGRIEPLRKLGLKIEEELNDGTRLPYAPEELDPALMQQPASGPRQYLRQKVKVPLKLVGDAIEIMAGLAGDPPMEGLRLVTGYLKRTGVQGEIINIWVMDGAPNLQFDANARPNPHLERLSKIAQTHQLEYLSPLPYSRLR